MAPPRLWFLCHCRISVMIEPRRRWHFSTAYEGNPYICYVLAIFHHDNVMTLLALCENNPLSSPIVAVSRRQDAHVSSWYGSAAKSWMWKTSFLNSFSAIEHRHQRNVLLNDELTSCNCNYIHVEATHIYFTLRETLHTHAHIYIYIIYIYNSPLTHWSRVTQICVDNITIIGSDNGLSPGRRQAIIWTNAGILLIRPLGTNFSEI